MDNTTTAPDVGKMVAEFTRLRDAKKIAKERFAELLKERYENRMDELQSKLLDLLNNIGSESVRSAAGTAYKIHNVSLTVENQQEWRRHVIGGELWDLLEWRPLKSAVGELVEAGEAVPPGLKHSVFITVGVRKN